MRFASMNRTQWDAISRKDDFEGIFYILLWLLNDFELPWDGVIGRISSSKYSEYRNSGQTIFNTLTKLPEQFAEIYK